MVESAECGKVSTTLEECVAFLKNFGDVRKKLTEYRNKKTIPSIIIPNTSLEELLFYSHSARLPVYASGRVRRRGLLFAIYSLMRGVSDR